ncbi:hypothetical protein [Commensalibacter nepenthis]|uniref:Uncharacterized protein n=1 Tax=Commensalibacter nepenthis TaxID=3043872 RepID=A0ABT6Q5P0_9PROT|nr:hypothetical protein [Commensalibacter sp. TBRC 10068]MDI2112211.1 hypothetical protein [Commensalibacter sp. TBRC 10068]
MALFLQQQAAIEAAGGASAAGNNPNAMTDADIKQMQNAYDNTIHNTEKLLQWGPLYAYAYLYNLIYGDTQSSGSISSDMTAHPDANKETILTTPITENKGTTLVTPIPDQNWWDSTVSTPITDQDKNSGIIADPISDVGNEFELPGYTADPDVGKGTIFTLNWS